MNRFPPGWDEAQVRRVIAYYEHQSEDEAVADDEAGGGSADYTMMQIPNDLVPAVRKLLTGKSQETS